MLFIQIENKTDDTVSISHMRMLGASTSRGQASKIGQFGSGFPYSLALLARHNLLSTLKVCVHSDIYYFTVREINGIKEICLNQQGSNEIIPLNISVDFGGVDWKDPTMAMREFISNAIDGAADIKKVSVVTTPEPKARKGTVRIFLQAVPIFSKYLLELYQNFPVLSPQWKGATIIEKKIDDHVGIYRKGVLVGRFPYKSLFHYNIDSIPVNECRLVDSYTARSACAQALLRNGSPYEISRYLTEVISNPTEWLWEHSLYVHQLNVGNDIFLDAEDKVNITGRWVAAVKEVFGNKILVDSGMMAEQLKSRGYETFTVKDDYVPLLKYYGIRTPDNVLSEDEMEGRYIREPSNKVLDECKFVWSKLEAHKLTNEKPLPEIKEFTQIECSTLGYQRDNSIFIRDDLDGLILRQTIIEEFAHYISGYTDCTRQFQDFAFRLAAVLME